MTARADAVRVEVADRSGPGVPELRPAGADAEDGRGLGLVAGLAAVGVAATWRADGDLVRNTGFIATDATFRGVRLPRA